MICYKDKTFCDAHTCTDKETCDKYFTHEDWNNAVAWWRNANVPICFFVQPPSDCYKPTKN